MEVTASGVDADGVLAALEELAADDFGDEPAWTGTAPILPPSDHRPVRWALLQASWWARPAVSPFPISTTSMKAPPAPRRRSAGGWRRASPGRRCAPPATRRTVARRAGEAEAGIFDAHLALLGDAELLADVDRGIAGGGGAPASWRSATIDSLADRFRRLDDEYQRERAADVEAVGRDVLAAMLGVEAAVVPSGTGILVAPDLDPGQTARLDREVVTGILLAEGGPTSHAAILARSLGIPAVVAAGRVVLDIADGTTVLIDGSTGEVAVAPDAERVRSATAAAAAERERARSAAELAGEPAVTTDGTVVEVAANLGSPDEAAAAVASGADGVGLFRTEFVFLGREDPPGEDEQEAIYRAVAETLAGSPAGGAHLRHRRGQAGAVRRPAGRGEPLPRGARAPARAEAHRAPRHPVARHRPRRRPPPRLGDVPHGEHRSASCSKRGRWSTGRWRTPAPAARRGSRWG